MIIALDGPAASGKGTLGKRIAAHYGLRHLDTGLLYRAVANALLEQSTPLDDAARAEEAAHKLDPTGFDEARLKGHSIGEAASLVSAIPQVRAALLQFQRDFANTVPGAVLDGRDIGTVVCPDADVKIFLVASPKERARRRAREMQARGDLVDETAILADIIRRDERDRSRTVAPLVAADDAHTLDTTELGVEAVFNAAVDLVERVRGSSRRATR